MSTQSPKISIIVPVYKVEQYLPKCIDSILSQTYQDWELLLIDDGSPDRSGDICEEYAQKDQRIKVFHKRNGGPSSARNLGLDNVKGEFICFVDSDDVVDNSFLENFGPCKTDITIQGLYAKMPNEIQENYMPIEDGVYDIKEFITLFNLLSKAKNTGYLVTRAFKRKIIADNHLRLNEKFRVREDEEFIWRYMCHCKTFSTVNKGAYHYEMPDFSSKYRHLDLDSDFECTKSIIESCSSICGGFNHSHIVNNINRLASIAFNSYRKSTFRIELTEKYIEYFKCCCKKIKNISVISFKSKTLYFLNYFKMPKAIHHAMNLILRKK